MYPKAQRKSCTILALAFLLFLASCASKKNDLTTKQANLYFGAGTQSLVDRQYTEALRNLLEANRLTPDRAEIINNLGMAYYFKGEKDLAVKHLNRSLELDNKNSDARLNLATIHLEMGDHKKAEALYREVMKDLTYEKQARTYYNLGLIELRFKKNVVGAENFFKKSINEDDNYCPAYFQLGYIQYKRRQFNSALKNFKEASLGTCYESPAPHYYQAMSYIELRRFDDARVKLNEIDTRFKKSAYATKSRAKMLEIDELESNHSFEAHASRKMLESPEF
jgi:type IV pilus assembly protein PilF